MKSQTIDSILALALLAFIIFQSGCKEEEIDNTQLPTLSTFPVEKITSQSALGGGEIINDGGAAITARGLVWNTLEDPTTENHEGMTAEGDGTGSFSSSLSNLLSYTTYYVRAYASNSKGTNYGNQLEFETLPEGAHAKVTDIDGNVYWTVAIDTIEWMAQNLRTSKYADGTPILTGLSDDEWENTNEGAYREIPYDDTLSNSRGFDLPLLEFESYGFLYNAHAADANPCPEGWHVAKQMEWNFMLAYLKLFYDIGDNQVGNAIKSCRQVNSPLGGGCKTDWHPRWDEHPTEYGTNKVFFLGLPAGDVDPSGVYSGLGKTGTWWTLNYSSGWPSRISLNYTSGGAQQGASRPNFGYSIRCIRTLAE